MHHGGDRDPGSGNGGARMRLGCPVMRMRNMLSTAPGTRLAYALFLTSPSMRRMKVSQLRVLGVSILLVLNAPEAFSDRLYYGSKYTKLEVNGWYRFVGTPGERQPDRVCTSENTDPVHDTLEIILNYWSDDMPHRDEVAQVLNDIRDFMNQEVRMRWFN